MIDPLTVTRKNASSRTDASAAHRSARTRDIGSRLAASGVAPRCAAAALPAAAAAPSASERESSLSFPTVAMALDINFGRTQMMQRELQSQQDFTVGEIFGA